MDVEHKTTEKKEKKCDKQPLLKDNKKEKDATNLLEQEREKGVFFVQSWVGLFPRGPDDDAVMAFDTREEANDYCHKHFKPCGCIYMCPCEWVDVAFVEPMNWSETQRALVERLKQGSIPT